MPLPHKRFSFSLLLIFASTKQEMSRDTNELNEDFLRGYDKTEREWRRQTVFQLCIILYLKTDIIQNNIYTALSFALPSSGYFSRSKPPEAFWQLETIANVPSATVATTSQPAQQYYSGLLPSYDVEWVAAEGLDLVRNNAYVVVPAGEENKD